MSVNGFLYKSGTLHRTFVLFSMILLSLVPPRSLFVLCISGKKSIAPPLGMRIIA